MCCYHSIRIYLYATTPEYYSQSSAFNVIYWVCNGFQLRPRSVHAVLRYLGSHSMVRWKAHDFWSSIFGHADGEAARECPDGKWAILFPWLLWHASKMPINLMRSDTQFRQAEMVKPSNISDLIEFHYTVIFYFDPRIHNRNGLLFYNRNGLRLRELHFACYCCYPSASWLSLSTWIRCVTAYTTTSAPDD